MSSPMHSLAGLTTSTGNCKACVISVLISLLRARYLANRTSQPPAAVSSVADGKVFRCVTSLCATEPAGSFRSRCVSLHLARLFAICGGGSLHNLWSGKGVPRGTAVSYFLTAPSSGLPFFPGCVGRARRVLFVLYTTHCCSSTTIGREANKKDQTE